MLASAIALCVSTAQAANYYFDVNGTTSGSGIVEGASYDVSIITTNWGTTTDGTATTAALPSNNSVYFSAGSDAAGLNYTVTGSLQQPSFLAVEEGFITLNASLDTLRNPTIRTYNGTSLNIANPSFRASATFDVQGTSSITLSRIYNGNGAGATLNKNGTGPLTITAAASNINGALAVTINNGELRIQNDNALYWYRAGQTRTVTVTTGGSLELDNNITIANNPITINGSGFNNGSIDLGALANYAGNNSYNSAIILGSDSRINNNAAGTTLTLNPAGGSALTGAYGLTLGGAGDITVSKPIEAISSLAIDGAGKLTLSGSNTYQGGTTISGGLLAAGGTHPFGDSTASVTVNPGAIVDLAGQTLVAGKSYILAGGSLSNSSGTATLLTAASATLVTGGSYAPGATPTVIIGSPGTAAAITPLLKLENTTVSGLSGGSGYSSTATATLTAAPSGGTTATATLSFGLTQDSITSVSGGTGWEVGASVSINGGATAALATVSSVDVGTGAITGLTLSTAGSGYTAAPTAVTKVTSATGNASGVVIVGSATKFTVSAVNVTSLGNGYTTAPMLTISAPNSGGTQATATSNSTIRALTFTDGGSGYTSGPTVTFGGGVVDATANGGFSSVNLTADSTISCDGGLVVNPVISSTGAFGFHKTGSGTLTLAGANTYTGTTTVTAGTLDLASTGSLAFKPTGASASNKITGAGAATLSGTLVLDLTGTALTNGNSWTLVDITTASYNLAAISSPGLSFSGSAGNWTATSGTNTWTFTNGVLSLAVSAGSDYDTWVGPSGYNLTGGPAGDDDHDGLTNFKEYAFGLIPTSGSSVNPISSPLNKSTGQFSYTRRNPALSTGVTYRYEYSSDLGSWNPLTPDATSSDSGSPTQTVTLTVPPGLLANTTLFVRVIAEN